MELILFLALYFVPVIVALVRGGRHFWAIAMVNLVGGWIPLVWLVALVWALMDR